MITKEYYKNLFPLLNDYELITNSENSNYNCISHTLGYKNKWSWPISSAKTEEDVIRLNNYTNFQPLCSKVNRDIKKDKLTW
jgi:hypothetical protein